MKEFLLSLLILGSLGLTGCSGGLSTGSASPAPAPAAPTAPTKSLSKIVAFGDSLTAGYGLATQENYPALLQEKLRADGYQYEVVNAGVSGDTSAGGLRRLDWALEGDVKVLILELGANDILRGQPVAAMKQNLGQIIERAQARGVQVLLAGMIAPPNWGREYQKEVYEAYRDLARQYQVPLIPFFLDRVAGVASLNLPDGIHPNPDGTKIVAETVYQALRPMLEK